MSAGLFGVEKWLALGLVVSLTGIVAANAPPPRLVEELRRAEELKRAKVALPVQVKHADLKAEGEGVQAKIVLPSRLRDAVAPAKPGAKVGQNDFVPPAQRSIVAAIALSLAAVSVVLVLRGKKLNVTGKAAILGVACLLGGIGAAQADLSVPPGRRPSRPVPERPDPAAAKQTIVIEFSDDAEDVVLTLPAK